MYNVQKKLGVELGTRLVTVADWPCFLCRIARCTVNHYSITFYLELMSKTLAVPYQSMFWTFFFLFRFKLSHNPSECHSVQTEGRPRFHNSIATLTFRQWSRLIGCVFAFEVEWLLSHPPSCLLQSLRKMVERIRVYKKLNNQIFGILNKHLSSSEVLAKPTREFPPPVYQA